MWTITCQLIHMLLLSLMCFSPLCTIYRKVPNQQLRVCDKFGTDSTDSSITIITVFAHARPRVWTTHGFLCSVNKWVHALSHMLNRHQHPNRSTYQYSRKLFVVTLLFLELQENRYKQATSIDETQQIYWNKASVNVFISVPHLMFQRNSRTNQITLWLSR